MIPIVVSDHAALLVHWYLLGGDVLATWAVGVGILWEAKAITVSHEMARKLVLWGVVVETLCSITLFFFDEGISRAQQVTIEAQRDKIIALDEEIAPRQLSEGQWNELKALFQKFPGQMVRVASYELDLEAGVLGWQIWKSAQAANLPTDELLQTQDAVGGELIGVSVTGTNTEMVSAVTSLFTKFKLEPTPKPPPPTAGIHLGGENAPLPLKIFVGVKRPAWMPP